MKDFLDNHKKEDCPQKDREIQASIKLLTRYLPESVKAAEFIGKFSQHLIKDSSLLSCKLICFNYSVSFKICYFKCLHFISYSYEYNCKAEFQY